jgi:glycosyltransferase involved in cell wall biosynthesis
MESDLTVEEVSNIIDSRPNNVCNLLFIGTRWDLKGGDMALEVAELLNQNGLVTTLHVIGIKPEIDQPYPDYLKCWGYINKSSDEGRQLLYKLIAHSHFLILPTKAEAFGHVFCEANSFGVPCLAPQTGGITTVIKNNVNGFIFPVDSDPEAYCNFITETLMDNDKYKQLALSSFKEYKSRLNWRVAAEKVTEIIRQEV